MSHFGADRSSAQPVPPIDSFVEVLPVAPQVERRRGILRFYGLTDFAEGEWAGVELVGCEGRNDGTVKGLFYFKCAAGQGLFVRPNLIAPYAPARPAPTLEAASAKIEALEEELRVVRREAVEQERLKDSLEASLHSMQAELEQLRVAAVQAAAKGDAKTEDDDDKLAVQVQLESVRLEFQRQLETCEAELKAAKQSAIEAAAACAAAEKREQQAESARQCSDAAQAALQTRNDELQTELTRLQAEPATAVTQQSQLAQNSSEAAAEASAACAELRAALRAKEAELLQLRAAHAEMSRTHEQLQERKAEEQERVQAAEKRCEEQQRWQLQDTAREDVLAAHASEIARLHAEIASVKTEKEALAKAQRDKEELQELCQLLEEELNEQKAQSDALTRLVQELGAAKAAAEAAVEGAKQSAAQERARLLRELEAARAPEVQVTAAGAVSEGGVTGRSSTSSTATAEKPSLEIALQQCRGELDEARARILQLASSQQVVQELQRRCEELEETMRVQRAEAQKSDDVARATLAAAQQHHAHQVALLRDACEAGRREAASMAAQLNLAAIPREASGGHSTAAAAPFVSPLDAFREARYEARIRSLEQLLLECDATRMSSAIWDVPASQTRTWRDSEVPLALLKEPVGRLLDFSTRDACAASAKALFQTPTASPYALQAEVRCQQDAYDHAVEVLHTSADTIPASGMLKLGIPLYDTHEEQIQALQDKYALATLETGALVALGPYRLLHTLKAHVTRIEDERRAGAVAAGNGGGVRKMRVGRAPFVRKSKTSIDTATLDGGKAGQTPQRRGVPPMSVRIKEERIDDDKRSGVAQQRQSLSEHSPLVSQSPLSTAATVAKAENPSAKGASVSSAGGAGGGGWGDGCPPSWMTLKAEAAEPPPSSETYNGAYFVPCPTPAGAPIARYVSSSVCLLSANNAAQSPSAPLPPLVAPVNCGTKVMSSASKKKRPAALPSQAPKRCRSVTVSQANAVATDETPFLSQAQRAKMVRMQEHVQFLGQASPPSSPSKEKLEGDRALRLWWRVWPSSPSLLPPDAEESGRQQRAAAAPPPAQHACVRPTPAMVAALIQVAEQNYKRDCERCAAQQAYLATLLVAAESLRVGGAAAGTGDTGNAGQAPMEATLESLHPKAVRQLQDELSSKQSKLGSAYAERLALLRELAEALRDESAVCVDEATASEAGEVKHAAPSSTPHSQYRAASPSSNRKRSRRASSTRHATRSSPTAVDVEVLDADRRGGEQAVANASTRSAAAGASALELLHSSLTDPASLMRKVHKARESLAFFSSETSSAEVTLGSRSQASSEEALDLPNGIVGVNLPSLEHDRNAPELAEYLWPEDLDARIRHELRGVVSVKSRNPEASSIHVVLSAARVQQLEETARAVSTVDPVSQLRTVVPPLVVGSIMAHPKFVENGWLYVHGRGETIVAGVELN
ncbi:CAP-Gly domain family protein [Leishmania donovani]|uniref:CAP-Gly domain family protein n=2 Tax=Leishmania donovani TaxID=5661 RepID=A0A504XR97_LEIDO|nr:CAP-Gly domain family protein [Leishmania donovani]